MEEKGVGKLALEKRRAFVIGAGFTKAFLPNAPLMIDDYGGEALAEKFLKFPYASRVLEWERSRNEKGRINIERLMTRLEGRMPYDSDQGGDEELGMLLTELKYSFKKRIEEARESSGFMEELKQFAQYCVNNRITCITTNYDDVLDEAIWKVKETFDSSDEPYWHPDGGYGFFCKPSSMSVQDGDTYMDVASMLLLKLHGSINWYPRKGHPKPYAVDAIMHHEKWYPIEEHIRPTGEAVELHIEKEPFIVPPILIKSAIVEQPILRLVWGLAYKALYEAYQVIFIGYSLPVTDIAVRVLFEEALELLPNEEIYIVNQARKAEQREIKDTYKKTLGRIADSHFNFGGALEWSQELVI